MAEFLLISIYLVFRVRKCEAGVSEHTVELAMRQMGVRRSYPPETLPGISLKLSGCIGEG